jgi:predicted acylesterase/phospholipase RssA/CRP-like cAMP-binding protein
MDDASPRASLSRDEILSGSWNRDRRAVRILTSIELRVAYMQAQSRRIIRHYVFGGAETATRGADPDYLQSIRDRVQSGDEITLDDIERYAAHWHALVPRDRDLRAAVANLLAQRYPLQARPVPGIRKALGFEAGAAPESAPAGAPGHSGAAPPKPDAGAPAPTDEQLLREIEDRLIWLHLPGGATLFRQGEAGDRLYILVTGRLRAVVVNGEGEERARADIGRDEVVGDLAVLTGEPRNASVYALRDSELVGLHRDDVMLLAQRYQQVWLRLTRILASRLQATHNGQPSREIQTIAVAGARAVPLARFAARLAEALASHGSVLHLTRAAVESRLGTRDLDTDDPAERARLLAWLEEQESGYRYVLYEADGARSTWTELGIRQADRLLLVADADADPPPHPGEEALRASTELVLIHPDSRTRPTGTRRRLESYRVLAHHHVRLGEQRDMARLARRLLGRATGLVLSGGGARGYAHVGALRALEEAGVEIDLIGGTSMGAYFGSASARGASAAELVDLCRRFGRRRDLLDPTLPFTSFFSAEKITRVIHAAVADWEFEDLWRPFFCVSSNLSTAAPVIHEQGPLWHSVRASVAIPTVFPPVLEQGDVLVDGGLMNNFPLDIMRERSPRGDVLGVDVSPEAEGREEYRFGPSVSGWQVLLGKLGLGGEPVRAPSLFSTLMRAIELGSAYRTNSSSFRELADLVIRPSVDRIGILDFASYDEAIEIGYRAAMEALERRSARPSTEEDR